MSIFYIEDLIMNMKSIFFDRDGVINEERGTYTFLRIEFIILPNVLDTFLRLKEMGFKLIVITNQAGISKGLYTREQMVDCHDYLQEKAAYLIDDFYYAPMHPDFSESLSRKPNSLMFERACSKHTIDPSQSFMVGDKESDLIPAKKMGMTSILLGRKNTRYADYFIDDISELVSLAQV